MAQITGAHLISEKFIRKEENKVLYWNGNLDLNSSHQYLHHPGCTVCGLHITATLLARTGSTRKKAYPALPSLKRLHETNNLDQALFSREFPFPSSILVVIRALTH